MDTVKRSSLDGTLVKGNFLWMKPFFLYSILHRVQMTHYSFATLFLRCCPCPFLQLQASHRQLGTLFLLLSPRFSSTPSQFPMHFQKLLKVDLCYNCCVRKISSVLKVHNTVHNKSSAVHKNTKFIFIVLCLNSNDDECTCT